MAAVHDPDEPASDTGDRPLSEWLDVDTMMAKAAAQNAAEIAEHGHVLPTMAHVAEVAYAMFEIGIWELSHENVDKARYWLSQAVDWGIEEARPLLPTCR